MHTLPRILLLASLVAGPAAVPAQDTESTPAAKPIQCTPIGTVEQAEGRTSLVLDPQHAPGLLGLDGFSHVWVIWWFDKNDTPQRRAMLQVHPRGNRENPLTGVFACRSPFRPNLTALSLCKILSVQGHRVEIEKIDAFDGTPILDLKPYIPALDAAAATLPSWLPPTDRKP